MLVFHFSFVSLVGKAFNNEKCKFLKLILGYFIHLVEFSFILRKISGDLLVNCPNCDAFSRSLANL